MHVLIVDDDRIICRCLEQRINWEKIGCDSPEIAYDGEMAVDLVKKRKPDIVISDVKMPVMDGTELCRYLSEYCPETAFIFISAYEDFATAQVALQYHVRGYIMKPMDSESLQELEKLISGIVEQRESGELYRKILADEYQEYLEKILKEGNICALDELFSQVAELHESATVPKLELWIHLMYPLFSYLYKTRDIDHGILFQEEQKLKDRLSRMNEEDREACLRECYLKEIKSTEDKDRNVIWEIQKYIKENFASADLNINMLSEHFHMSSAYLGRMYYEQTGTRLLDYIIQKRMQYACERLKTGNDPVKKIAAESGYADANYFTKVFCRQMNMSPLEYRRKYGK